MKKIKRIMAVLICMTITLTGIPVSVNAENSGGKSVQTMETGNELFITLEENTRYRWNVNDSAEKNSVVHLDTSGGDNCRFRLDHIENEWYGIKHIKVDGTDRFADVDGKSKNNGAVLHLWESSDSKVKGNNHRQFAFYYIGNDANGNARYYIKNRNSGKWIGYEGELNNNNPKIIQTDEKNRKVWLITKSVVPFTGKESQVLHKDDKTAVCEIHKAGELAALNRRADSLVPGALPHFYTMGTTSKWKLTWVKDYNAYQIESISEGEKDTGLALDVQSESGRMNTTINLWVEEEFDHNQNTSQLWRFFKQSDGTYLIQNARSGLYILETVNGLKLGEQGTKIDLSILAGNTEKTKYYYAENWMANIPDDALLSSVNIPATHDTGTAGVVEDDIPQVSITSCQNLYYDEQLNMGARSFDIRANATKDDASVADVKIVHGGELWQCQEKNGSDLTLQSILNTSLGFLEKHKSETVILTVKSDAGSTIGLEHAVAEFIEKNKDKVYSGGNIPSMKEARGKIIFLRRFNLTKNYESSVERAMGFNLANWDDIKYKDYKYAYKLYDDGKNHVYIQDAYNTYGSEKWPYILETMKQTTGQDTSHPIEYNSWVFNYTSCSRGAPLGLTREINPRLFKDEGNCIDNRFLGTVMLNFIDEPMSRLIYETNSNMIFEPKLPTPEATTIVQEDILSGSTTDEDGDDILGAYGNAGKYVILKDNASNSNYDVVVRPAFLNVSQKEAEIEWNAATQYTYTGNACGIEANVKADSLLENDSCEIKRLLNAQRTEVGSYKALAIGLTNANYIFSGMRRVCVWKYEILPADPEVTFPTVEVTYGDSLRKAVRTGQSGNGVFRFADNTAMLTVAENQSEQEMIFTPFNPNYKTVTSSVPVTVLPRKLTISPERTEKEYGQTITEYTWSISDGSLAGDDQLEDLKINVTLTAGNAEKENCKVGLYDITEKTPLTADNVNYTVLFKPGTLQVQPKPLGVAWNTDGTVIDTGKEANVSAEFTGVLFEDDCKAVVEGGNEIKTGTYTATIVGMIGEQSDNYVLHGEDTDYQIEYQIVKKEETKNPTDSKETSTGTAGKKPTGTSVSGKQVKTAKTGDSISYIWILMIAGSIAVIGGMIYVIRRRKQK